MNSKLHRSRGIVLLLVLGILAIMSVLAVSFVNLSRLERGIAQNYLDKARALMVAESGVEYAMSRIQALPPGVIRGQHQFEMQYQEGPDPALEHAVKASFQNPQFSYAVSGVVADTHAPNSDYYVLKIEDESGKLNLNDTDGTWNVDDDPVADDELTDPDLLNAPHRLAVMVEKLAANLFGDAMGTNVSIAIFDTRATLHGGRFSSVEQVSDILRDLGLDEDQIREFLQNVTLDAWQDPHVLKPTFRLHVSAPSWAPVADVSYQENVSNPYFNIYLYSDFQTRYFETEPRSPVCVNAASVDLIDAIIAPLQGWYLYEGAPASLMDAGYLGPWTRAMRETSNSWLDYQCGANLASQTYSGWDPGTPDAWHPGPDTQLGNQTRYGEARLTRSFEALCGKDFDGDGAEDTIARAIAWNMHERIHTARQPFLTWDDFTRFVYEHVDTSVEIVSGEFTSPAEEAQRFPYRSGDLPNDSAYPNPECGNPIPGFDRYMADALLANVCPNPMLNDHNPDFHVFRHVDKTQLTAYTTEFCLEPTGIYSIRSKGLLRNADNVVVSSSEIVTRIKLFHRFRVSTQEQFMRDFDQTDHNSLYNIIAEAGAANFPAAGADILHGSGDLSGSNGPSLTSYPEPIRNNLSYTIERHPDEDLRGNYFSKFAGSLMLSTQQRARDQYPGDTAGGTGPMFLAPMSWRKVTSFSTAKWAQQSYGVGGMLPVLWGGNMEENYELSKKSGVPIQISSDNVDNVAVPDGRGVMLLWNKLYSGILWDDDGWSPYPILDPPGSPHVPKISTAAIKFPYWVIQPDLMNYDAPWFDPATGKRYERWENVDLLYSDHDVMVPVMFGALLDGNTPVWGLMRGASRLAWNYPTDCPLTPSHRDAADARVDRVQGNLYPDGAFSEPGRLLSYPATNLGSNGGFRGAVGFWAKPQWDAGFSNSARQFFGMGHVGRFYLDSLGIYYFPASPHTTKSDFPTGGSDESVFSIKKINSYCRWPLVRNSFFVGTMHTWWSEWPGPEIWYEGNVACSSTATDFMPYRNISQRAMHESLGFYGHQWNFMALNYDMDTTGSPASTKVEFVLNGTLNDWYAPNVRHFWFDTTNPIVPGEFDPYWEEAHFHGVEALNGGAKQGEPEFNHMGEGYMRFGFNDEAAGTTANSTFDEIVTWPAPVSKPDLDDIWHSGRYINFPMDGDPGGTAIGQYTSPAFDPYEELGLKLDAKSSSSVLRLHSISWTLWWPRYNWRPSDNSATHDWKSWYGGVYDGMPGVDLQSVPGEPDPVTGDWDPVTVDLWDPVHGKWAVSGDVDGSNATRFSDTMPCTAAGSKLPQGTTLEFRPEDDFRFRVFFHLNPGTPLLESPVFDDITFTFTMGKPTFLSWQVL